MKYQNAKIGQCQIDRPLKESLRININDCYKSMGIRSRSSILKQYKILISKIFVANMLGLAKVKIKLL